MNKDEKILEILNSKPSQKIGLDDFYGRQTVINMLKEAINYSRCKSDSDQLFLFADWLQYNGRWDLPEKQAENFLKEQQEQN